MKLKNIILIILLLAGSGLAQKTWEKPYAKWSKDDALNIAMSSPWAKSYQSVAGSIAAEQVQIARDQRDRVNNGGNGTNAGSAGRANLAPVVARLHSGLPIRQAITRGRQLAAGYDKMSDADKKQYDEGGKAFLECAICKTYYVVSITSFPDSTNQFLEEGVFQRSTLNDLKGLVTLVNDKGEARELFQFTPPKKSGDAAYFFFPRLDDKGNTLITKDTKDFKLLFAGGFFVASNPYQLHVPKTFEFRVSSIMIGNEIMF